MKTKEKNKPQIIRNRISHGLSILMLILVMLPLVSTVTAAKSKKSKLSPEHKEFYKYARYLMTKEERKLFFGMPAGKDRDEFVKYFWEIRDPNPMSDENEFRIEIERRYEYVNKYLKEGPIPGWKSDRGRLYIMLGAPNQVVEQNIGSQFGREIWWYFEDSDIYARFVDNNGNGIYTMDLRRVSLRLLDEMERRKYYIVNKGEKEKFETEILKFDLSYNKNNKEIIITVDGRNLSYNKDPQSEMMVAKIKVALVIYNKDNKFNRYTSIQTAKISSEQLLQKKSSKINFQVPLELPAGKLKIDAIITDFLGDAVRRKFIKITN